MKNLQEATERICDLKGSLVALNALVTALLHELPPGLHAGLLRTFNDHTEVARTVLLHTPISEHTIVAFERDVARMTSLIAMGASRPATDASHVAPAMPVAPHQPTASPDA